MKYLLILLLFSSCKTSILFYPTGISNGEGIYYIYQPVNRMGSPKTEPILYYCDCELELRDGKVYYKGTNEEVK